MSLKSNPCLDCLSEAKACHSQVIRLKVKVNTSREENTLILDGSLPSKTIQNYPKLVEINPNFEQSKIIQSHPKPLWNFTKLSKSIRKIQNFWKVFWKYGLQIEIIKLSAIKSKTIKFSESFRNSRLSIRKLGIAWMT